MPILTDPFRIRTILDGDRPWAAYAIGDLSPDLVGHTTWYAPVDGSTALVMLYSGFDPPIAFAIGPAAEASLLLRELEAPAIALHVRPEVAACLEPAYRAVELRKMWRMVVEPSSFRPVSAADVRLLAAADLDAVNALYEDGYRHGDGPTFFQPSMLDQGTFRGIWEGSDLIAVAGTHLSSTELAVCAIGNVYTRHDRRRQRLASRATSAVVADAIAGGVSTIVLNVSQENIAARRVYERLGFRCHCEFVEGEAVRSA